jgi:hypothetical protein
MGLPVLVPIIWGLFGVFRTGLRTFRETESRFRAGVTLGALGGIVAILIHSIWDFNIQITANGILFSVLVGLVVGSSSPGTTYVNQVLTTESPSGLRGQGSRGSSSSSSSNVTVTVT